MKRFAVLAAGCSLVLFVGCAEREKPEPTVAPEPTVPTVQPLTGLQKLKGLPVQKPFNAAPGVGGGGASASASAPAASASAK